MNGISVHQDKQSSGIAAAQQGAALIRAALEKQGYATIIVATGASQFNMLEQLVREELDWSKVEAFHLDEYVGLPVTHPASFRKYLKERFVERVPLKAFHYVEGDAADAKMELERLKALISPKVIDVAFIGVGENGHIAFNDPPADFTTEEPYLVVDLDQACRRQQLGEGWFPTVESVPPQAISMSVRQIMKCRAIINTVPDARKAKAVFEALTGPIGPQCPASILRQHPACHWFLDAQSAALLPKSLLR
jgi:glucosamine-6-phosphate deaminase